CLDPHVRPIGEIEGGGPAEVAVGITVYQTGEIIGGAGSCPPAKGSRGIISHLDVQTPQPLVDLIPRCSLSEDKDVESPPGCRSGEPEGPVRSRVAYKGP